MSYNRQLAQMNRDRALAQRQAKERAANPPQRKHCHDCGAAIYGAFIVIVVSVRPLRTHVVCAECARRMDGDS
jgi:hypothetical protein